MLAELLVTVSLLNRVQYQLRTQPFTTTQICHTSVLVLLMAMHKRLILQVLLLYQCPRGTQQDLDQTLLLIEIGGTGHMK